jgi:DNA-binding HxlR family transcriptional regulator
MCPCRDLLDMVASKWTALAIGALEDGPKRFGELKRRLDGVSQKMLTQTLRRMENMALVERRRYAEAPPRVEYSLTAAGRDLLVPIFALGAWADEHGDTVRNAVLGEI